MRSMYIYIYHNNMKPCSTIYIYNITLLKNFPSFNSGTGWWLSHLFQKYEPTEDHHPSSILDSISILI